MDYLLLTFLNANFSGIKLFLDSNLQTVWLQMYGFKVCRDGMLVYVAGTVSNNIFCDRRVGKDGCHVCYISHSACPVKTSGISTYCLDNVIQECTALNIYLLILC